MNVKDRKIRLLIVDDNEAVRTTLRFMLSGNKFVTDEAENGKKALEKITRNRPDIIILDGEMPVMDGVETYRRLKRNPETKRIPIIFCTAAHIAEVKMRKIEADDYLEKPFSREILCKKIRRILKNK